MVLFSTRNLRIKGVPKELRNHCVGPFKVEQKIGKQAYKVSLPDTWEIHPVFHILLLKRWHSASLQDEEALPAADEIEVEEPYYEIESS